MTDDLRKDGSAQMTNPSDEKLIERLEERNEPGYLNIISDDTICELLDLIGQAAERLRTLAAERDEARADKITAENFILKTDGKVVTIGDLRKAAAAPELLEAARFLADQLDELINRHYGGELPCSREEMAGFEQARAAIAKAEGRTDD